MQTLWSEEEVGAGADERPGLALALSAAPHYKEQHSLGSVYKEPKTLLTEGMSFQGHFFPWSNIV